jgi:hypothetical protein
LSYAERKFERQEKTMGYVSKQPTEGGSGGKRGHSNMERRVYNDEVKEASRRKRRQQDREVNELRLNELSE